jgi:hypothetical protein
MSQYGEGVTGEEKSSEQTFSRSHEIHNNLGFSGKPLNNVLFFGTWRTPKEKFRQYHLESDQPD